MGANPEHKVEHSGGHGEPIAWISREHVSIERISVDGGLAPATDGGASTVVQHPAAADAGSPSRVKWTLGVLAIVVAVAVAAAVWMSRASAPSATTTLANAQSIPLVSVMSPGVTAVTSNVTFTGAISARYDMPIGIDGDAGRIVGIYVEAGDHVKKGQLLAKLDDSVLVPQVNRLAASLEQTRAQAALSAAEYRRAQAVAPAGALSAEDVEKRRATQITDEATVKVAAAQLAEFEARLNRTHVVAPVDGTVLMRKAEVGQIANPGGDALFRIASGGEVEMRGQIAEQDLAVLKTGQPAAVYITGLARPFEGRVRLLGAVIDPNTRLGEIRIALKPDPALRPGAFARGSVIVDKAERPVLPQTAVMSDSQGTYVYVINADSHVERRPVSVGGTIDAGIIVSAGLTGSERVVTTAGGFLRNGERVTVAPAASSASDSAPPPPARDTQS
ncbi:MAG TPA: efflux RND transporter periplasmic adaptor subunit [Steroidobacteraceae bacterium]|nr:efflux RND transporter periplasmic adaptor subunit [Steroidobacteraceae bacterium]